MKISYTREIKHNYLVVTPGEEGGAGYEADMLSANEIRGLMPMQIRYRDGGIFYYYDITSRQPLNRLLETRFITRDEICRILMQLHGALMEMEEYLLDDGGILLEPELIYVEPELFQAELCLVPGRRGNFPEQLSRFLQYILKCVNHKDRECVVLAYGMYQESLKENYGLEDILKFISPGGDRGAGDRAAGTAETAGNGPGEWAGGEKTAGWNGEAGREEDTEWDEDTKLWEQTKRNKETPKIRERRGLSLVKQMGFWLAAAVLLPALLWLFKGVNALREFRWVLICLDGGLLLVIGAANALVWRAGGRKDIKNGVFQEDKTKDSPWRILYEDEEQEAPFPLRPAGDEPFSPRKTVEETFQTTLLSSQSGEEVLRRLKPIADAEEEIIISYYPFVIGKNKNLADYALEKDTVSRFHLRIDEEGGRYTVTDLNSTNGTRVRGRLLDANETAAIENGDEIYIADTGYIFS